MISYLILDFKKPEETLLCLQSIKKNSDFAHKVIYLDNGGNEEYPFNFYKNGLCDVLISKNKAKGGGEGQTDLIRYCDTEYFIFVQNDQILQYQLDEKMIGKFEHLLNNGYKCIDLNGDQSNKGQWTDRAHMMKTADFNSLAPFPNGGPGWDSAEWNEAYLQRKFIELGWKIAHISPVFFRDNGKTSKRQSGDGIFLHYCDTKQVFVEKQPTYLDPIYPPFNEAEREKCLAGKWVDGDIPEAWKSHSFVVNVWH